MRIVDACGGIGAFSLAFTRRGHECVAYYEIDERCVDVYNRNFKTDYTPTDITKLDARNVPDHDVLCAGIPCQSFSISGRRQGFQDIRGTLFAEVARIAKAKRPRLVIIENVPGLLSIDSGRCFATILLSMVEAGFPWIEWEILNSKYFGIPQNRERVFIVCHSGEERPRTVFLLGQGDGILTQKDDRQPEDEEGIRGEDIASAIDSRYGALRNAGETYIMQKNQRGEVVEKDIVGSLPSAMTNQTSHIIEPVMLTEKRTEEAKEIRRGYISRGRDWCPRREKYLECRVDGIAGCITANRSEESLLVDESAKVRRLMPIECEKLMGFSPGWTEFGQNNERISDTQRYKMCGNAIVVNVIEAIVEKLEKVCKTR